MIKKITFDFKYSFYVERNINDVKPVRRIILKNTNYNFIYKLLYRTIEFYLNNLNYYYKIHSLNIYRIDPLLIIEKICTQLNEKREIITSSSKYTASIVLEYENEELLQLFQANSVLHSTLFYYQIDIVKNDFQKIDKNEIFENFDNLNENNIDDFFSVYYDMYNEVYRLHNLHAFKLISVKDINTNKDRLSPQPSPLPLLSKNYLFIFLIIALILILLK